jgi:cytochrome c-type biogenesis protein CcmH
VLLAVLIAFPAWAQDAGVTADDVNAVAKQMYCPVCPNETLDACRTQACVQWRAEIRQQLEQGQTPQEVIDSFVRRYGDRVVPIPQDPTLRLLSIITPFVIAGIALVVAVLTFRRWRVMRPQTASAAPIPPSTTASDPYRALIERDLSDRE